MLTAPRTLDRLACSGDSRGQVHKSDLRPGDWVLVTTKNSTYSILVLGDDRYRVTGGWFSREGTSPADVGITGCTWGGRAIHTGLLAAPGLFLEFGNRVSTTRIRKIAVIRALRWGCFN